MGFESRTHNTPLMERKREPHFQRAEVLIEKYAPHLVPEIEGQWPAYWQRVERLAQELADAEYDRFVEWSAKERAS